MSRRPAKKSDRGRPWRSGERRSARYVRVQMTRHLIVCEGTRTEPSYFEGLKVALGEANGRKVDVRVVGTGMHTISAFGQPYGKSDDGLFAKLRSRLADARANAARLDAHHERMGNIKPSEKCPGTAVHGLFDEIDEFLAENPA